MSDTPEFVDGLIVKAPHEKASDFVKCAISIKRSELISWLSTRTDDWINLDVKVSKKGGWYAQVNNWNPSKQDVTAQQSAAGSYPSQTMASPVTNPVPSKQDLDEFNDDIPF